MTVKDRENMSVIFYVLVIGFIMYVILCIRSDVSLVISMAGRF